MVGAASTAERVHAAAIHVLRLVRARDEADGLSPARLSLLSVLVFAGPATVKALAEAEGISSPSATSLVNGLEAAGLARRSRNAHDGRAVDVAVTAKGRAAFERARRRRLAQLTTLLEALPAGELEALERATDVLLRLRRV